MDIPFAQKAPKILKSSFEIFDVVSMGKYIFMTGGVVSSLGKGLTSASIALLLEARGYKVAMLKLDPYLNVDPGTMSPYQHGEVYVTDDGAETDLDLGHYHRFTNAHLSKFSNTTSGQVYDTVIKNERHGDYLGKTVQVIPHVTDEIKRRILLSSNHNQNPDVTFVEIGGTVGDIESLPFLEAIRQFRLKNSKDCINIHLTYVPYLKAAGELKTKPTQHSVQVLRGIGIIPDLILCRCENPLPQEIKDKIALFCSVPIEAVIEEPDVEHSIYEVPLSLKHFGLDTTICKLLGLKENKCNIKEWEEMVRKIKNPKKTVSIGIVGKYLQHQDAYKSVFEALTHAAIEEEAKLNIISIDAEKFSNDKDIAKKLKECDGILIPGGFGERGFEGKIKVAKYAREHKIPFFGICLGMQVLAVEFARNVLRHSDANSTEMEPETSTPIISLLSEQSHVTDLGGTMRLGAYTTHLVKGTKANKAYKENVISERHRHRYEFNNTYIDECKEKGLIVSGLYKEKSLCEILEIKDHPWMLGSQFHPEFKSKPTKPHPLFGDFIKASINNKKGNHG